MSSRTKASMCFLESLNRLNRDKNLKKKVLAFVNVPSWVGDPREDLQRRLKKQGRTLYHSFGSAFHYTLAAQYDA